MSKFIQRIISVLPRPVLLWFFFFFILTGFLIPVTIAVFMPDISEAELYHHKGDLQTKLTQAIKNNADLETIKHIFARNEPIYFSLFTTLFKNVVSEYYRFDVTLNQVLMDVKASYYIDHKDTTVAFLTALSNIIRENNELNPFDRLEANQKYFFENVRAKSGLQYLSISQDLYNISEELVHKNQLVNEYLADSEWSYRLSIVALVVSVLAFSLTLFQFLRSKLRQRETAAQE